MATRAVRTHAARRLPRALLRKDTVTPAQDPHHDRRWLILGVIAIAQLMVVLDVTIVNIALPSAQGDLGFSDDDAPPRRTRAAPVTVRPGALLRPTTRGSRETSM